MIISSCGVCTHGVNKCIGAFFFQFSASPSSQKYIFTISTTTFSLLILYSYPVIFHSHTHECSLSRYISLSLYISLHFYLDEIRATVFGEAVDDLYQKFELGKVPHRSLSSRTHSQPYSPSSIIHSRWVIIATHALTHTHTHTHILPHCLSNFMLSHASCTTPPARFPDLLSSFI